MSRVEWKCPGLPVYKDRPAAGSRGGGGTLSVQRRWGIVCSEEVGHCLFRGGGTLSVQRRWDIVCSEEVGHCLFRGGGTLSVQIKWDITCSEEVGHSMFFSEVTLR